MYYDEYTRRHEEWEARRLEEDAAEGTGVEESEVKVEDETEEITEEVESSSVESEDDIIGNIKIY